MVTEDYVSFETAKLLKEKGFDAECHSHYYPCHYPDGSIQYHKYEKTEFTKNTSCYDIYSLKNLPKNHYLAPTLQMAMKWLRDVHKIGVFPTTFYRHTETFDGHNYGCTLVNLKTFDVIGNFEDCTFPADSYEQTCEAAIKYCLGNLI